MRTITKKNRFTSLFFGTLFIVSSCSTVPITGRKQVSLMPESTMISMATSNYNEFLSSNKLSSDKVQTTLVKKVGENIAQAVELYFKNEGLSDRIAGYNWEFNLVESEVPNAWCMPGGKVVFYTGILPITKTKAGMAVVMGHEIAHAVARHGNERMSQQILVQGGGVAVSQFVKDKPEKTQETFLTLYGIGSAVGVMLPYSRAHESEADKLGLIFMAMAGYNPNEAISFWERMAAMGGQKPPEFLSTHPSDNTRINNLKEFLPEAMKYYKR